MNLRRQFFLGAFFVGVLALLGWYTLFHTDFSLFKQKTSMTTYFPEAYGLRQGDAVLVAGLRTGRVKSLTYDSTAELARRVTVTFLLDQPIELREGFSIAIKDSTLLGGKMIEIDPGPPGLAVIPVDTLLFGKIEKGALSSLGEFIDKNGARVENIVKNIDDVVADVKAGKGTVGRLMRDDALADQVGAAVKKIDTTFDNATSITNDLKDGKGTLGRLLKDEELFTKIQQIADRLKDIGDNLSATTADINAGKGVIGRLVKDDQLSDDVSKAVKSIREITEKINGGQGSFGKFVNDDTIANDLKDLAEKLKNGDGTLGKLIANDELYQKIAKIADDLSEASDALKTGRGTLGKLVMDSELYDQVARALATVTRTLEEYREAAPISTFTSVLFSAF